MGFIGKSRLFFTEAKKELKKVTWPSKQQVISSTWVVLIMVIVMAAFFGVVDFVVGKAIKLILHIG